MFRTLVIICIGITLLATDGVSAYPEGMKLHKRAMTWTDAYSTCQSKGSILASPITDSALTAMKAIMGVKNTTYFIGVKVTDYARLFVSVEGVPFENFPMSVMGMIDSIDELAGDCLAINSESIYAVPCWKRLPYICYDTNVYKISENDKVLKCGLHEEGYKFEESTNKCYKVYSERIPWHEAIQKCVRDSSHLVVLEDAKEAEAVWNMVQSNVKSFVWIGLRDVSGSGTFMSIHGQPVDNIFNLWHQDSKPTQGNYCSGLRTNKLLGWTDCNDDWPFVCERVPSP